MKRASFLLPAFLVTATCLPTARAQIYVNGSLTTGSNDGSSWPNAFRGDGDNALQSAIEAASSGGEIWVAAGTNYPTSNTGATARSISFVLNANVKIRGGFNGTETVASQADPVANPTILSGEINNVHSNLDNSRRVVTTNSANINSLLDGLTIRDGFNDGVTTASPDGAGIAISSGSTPKISRCILTNNVALNGRGAGIFINGTASGLPQDNPTISDCTITGNSGREGAGFALKDSSPAIDHCTINDNVATLRGGGGLFEDYSVARVTDCTFSRNEAVSWNFPAEGGGVVCVAGDPESNQPIFRNCQFTFNDVFGGNAGGASVRHAQPTFIRCNFTANSCTLLSSIAFGLSGRGGGIWLDQGGRVLDCRVTINSVRDDVDGTPAGRGGGIFAAKVVDFPIVNTEFYWNLAERGGGLHVASLSEVPPDEFSCRIHVINCSFTQNTASNTGGGVEALGGEVQTFTNCIFWNNSAADSSTLNKNFHAATGSPPAIPNHCCNQGGTGTYGSNGNIDADPKFNHDDGLEGLDLTLRSNSPCIDAGDTPPVPADQFDVNAPDGNLDEKTPDLLIAKRVMDDIYVTDLGVPTDETDNCGVVDMGAFELPRVCGTGVLGDMNGDGVVDFGDISLFEDCMDTGDFTSDPCRCADMNHDFNKTKADATCFADALLGGYPCVFGVPCLMPWESQGGGGGGQNSQSTQGEGNGGGGEISLEGFPEQWVEFLTWLLDHPREDYELMSDEEYKDWIGDVAMNMLFGVPMP